MIFGTTRFAISRSTRFLLWVAARPLPRRKRKGQEEKDESAQLRTAPRIRGSRRHDRAGSPVCAFRPK